MKVEHGSMAYGDVTDFLQHTLSKDTQPLDLVMNLLKILAEKDVISLGDISEITGYDVPLAEWYDEERF